MINRRALMRRWADATRDYRWDEAEQLWRELMAEWLTLATLDQASLDQGYWNNLLDRRMRALERKEQRSTISDNEWDNTHGNINQ